MKKIISLLVVVGVIFALLAFDVIPNPFIKKEIVTPVERINVNEVIEDSINGIGELYTTSYLYTMHRQISDANQLLGIKLPSLFDNKIDYLYSGNLRVGVDLNKASVDVDGSQITISFPELIAHNTYDESSIDIINGGGLLQSDKESIQKYQKSREDNINDIIQNAEEHDIYNITIDNLQTVLENQILGILKQTNPDKKYILRVKILSPEINYQAR